MRRRIPSMARLLPQRLSQLTLYSLLLSLLLPNSLARKNGGFARTLSPKDLGLNNQKLSKFRLYWHDIVSGRNPTSVRVVTPPMNTSTSFGLVRMFDDPLTEGQELSSKLIGRAQGFYASASQEEYGLLMAMNFAIMEGKYNGSTITVFGRNTVFSKVREMPVIGGTGLFRFARGYVRARTHFIDLKTRNAIVLYTCYVLHY